MLIFRRKNYDMLFSCLKKMIKYVNPREFVKHSAIRLLLPPFTRGVEMDYSRRVRNTKMFSGGKALNLLFLLECGMHVCFILLCGQKEKVANLVNYLKY